MTDPLDDRTDREAALVRSRAEHEKSTRECYGHGLSEFDAGFHDSGFRTAWNNRDAEVDGLKKQRDEFKHALEIVEHQQTALREELAVAREARDANYAAVLDLRSELAEAKAALEKARTFQNENAKIAVRLAEENKRLREALLDLIEREDPRNVSAEYNRIAESFFKETGLFAPGKSIPPAMGLVYTADEEAARSLKWRGFVNGWHEENFDQARAALKETKP